jgi:phosphoglycerate dehydrogenase-like enzyme
MKILFIEMPEIEKQCRNILYPFGIESFNYIFKKENDIPYTEIEIIVGVTPTQTLDLAQFPNLKLIQLPSAGYDQIPTDEIKKRNVILANASGVYSIPISEWVIGKILEIIKQTKFYLQNQEKLIWKKNNQMIELPDRKALIFGTGSIGQEIAKRLKAFDVIVDGVNSNGRDIIHFRQCFSLDEGKQEAGHYDILIFSMPNNQDTAGLVDEKFIKTLKDTTILINVGRGTLINEKDLISALNKGKFAGVALDVMQKEPLPTDSELWTHPKVYITPHSSFISDGINKRRVDLITANILAYYHHKEIKNRII